MFIAEEGTVFDWSRSAKSILLAHAERGVASRMPIVPLASHNVRSVRGEKQFRTFVFGIAAVAGLVAEETEPILGDIAYRLRRKP